MRMRFRVAVISLILLLILVGIVMLYVDQKARNENMFVGTAHNLVKPTEPILATYQSQTQTAAAWTKTPTVVATITP
jgi:hypothetical protein